MAPSTTEILFALGLGERVVGVTRYCDYPETAKELPGVGGLADPNYEQIIALRPDLVVLVSSHRDAQRELERLGINTLVIPHKTVGDVHKAVRLIAGRCGAENKAQALLADFEKRTQAVQAAVKGRRRPRVMICIGRDTGSGELAGMYMAGPKGFYDELIELAGGQNAFDETTAAFPQFSAEGVIQVNPEVIVDLTNEHIPSEKAAEEVIAQWDGLRSVDAVKNGRIYLVSGNHALRPGPRYIRFLEELAQLLHPEAFAEKPPSSPNICPCCEPSTYNAGALRRIHHA
jgi:iron complex transport system substrate-binding protein